MLLKSHLGHRSTPTLSIATALPKLVTSLRNFDFYRSELDRVELPKVPGTPCSPDPAHPQAVSSGTVVVVEEGLH